MRGGKDHICVFISNVRCFTPSPSWIYPIPSNPCIPNYSTTALHSCDAFFSLNDCNMIIEDREYANWSFLFKYSYKYLLMLKPMHSYS